MNSYTIELVSEKDLVDILVIYNQAIEAKDNAILKTIDYDTFKDEFSKETYKNIPYLSIKNTERY